MALRASASNLALGFSIREWNGVLPYLVVEEQQQIIRDVQQSHTLTRMGLDSRTSAKQGLGL